MPAHIKTVSAQKDGASADQAETTRISEKTKIAQLSNHFLLKGAGTHVASIIDYIESFVLSWLVIIPVFFHALVIPTSMFMLIASLLLLQSTWVFSLVYCVAIFLDTRSEDGTALQNLQLFCRRSFWWKMFAAYFPITLHKTVDLAPEAPPFYRPAQFIDHTLPHFFLYPFIKYGLFSPPTKRIENTNTQKGGKYIFAVSPHGIISMGAFCAIGTDGCNWSKLFPGITPRLLTIGTCFSIPFYRQYALLTGCASVSRKSCVNLLNNNQSISIIVGGTRESLLSKPHTFDLILNCRRGIVRIALETGASLVPVLSFGENEIYNSVPQNKESLMYKMNEFIARSAGIALPTFMGRGLLCDFGLVPFRRPINVVVGRPVPCPLLPNYTDADVDKYQKLYIDGVISLFNENVDKYSPGMELRIVE